jgi:hypothetical protein
LSSGKTGIYHDLSLFSLCYHLNKCVIGGEEIKVSSLLESIEKELKRKAYETMIDCLQSYQGQVEEAIEEFQDGTRAFYRANAEYVPHWQGASRYTGLAANRGMDLCDRRRSSS